MPFLIEWVQQCPGEPIDRVITTPIGNFWLQCCNDVICQADWAMSEKADELNEGIETEQKK